MGVPETDPLAQLSLPPGFRFYPTDEELLVQYLCRKVAGHHFSLQIIAEIDLYKFDPWDLPSKAIFGEKEWYFFSPRDRKYPNGSRPNRVAGSGYWKATGTDKIITAEGRTVGIKKALVFYVGKAPKGTKTNWIMHEYRLISSQHKKGSSKLDEWVLCRIYKKNSSSQRPTVAASVNPNKEHSNNGSSSSSSSHFDDMLDSLPEIDDRCFPRPPMNSLKTVENDEQMGSRNLGCGNMGWASLAGLNSVAGGQTQVQSLGIPTYVNNDNYFPSIPPLCHVDSLAAKGRNSAEEEVQSGFRTQWVENSGFFQPNPGVLTQNFTNSVDPFGFRYPTQPSGFGFRQ